MASIWKIADEITATNISQPMSLSMRISRALSSSKRSAAVCHTMIGMMNSSDSSAAEQSCVIACGAPAPSIRRIWAASTAAKGTSSADAKSVITRPSWIANVSWSCMATTSPADAVGSGGGMNPARKTNAPTHRANIIGWLHAMAFCTLVLRETDPLSCARVKLRLRRAVPVPRRARPNPPPSGPSP